MKREKVMNELLNIIHYNTTVQYSMFRVLR
jgi:hypothetical protein